MKILFITISPSPYIVYLCNQIEKKLGNSLSVVYCSKPSSMPWEKLNITHQHIILTPKRLTLFNHHYFVDTSIWKIIKEFNPDGVVVCGFQIPMMLGILFTYLNKRKLYFMSDAWELKDKNLSWFHKFIRTITYKNANAVFPVSKKGQTNFLTYKVPVSKIFIVPYIIDISSYSKYRNNKLNNRDYDILFSGQFIDRKLPFFFAEIAKKLRDKRGSIKILILGYGPLEKEFLKKLTEYELDYHFSGFVEPSELAEYYGNSKVFLFTTVEDSWGVVANEAIAAYTPVITSPHAGAAGEIVMDGVNGFVLPHNCDIWVDKIDYLLNRPDLYLQFQNNCASILDEYSMEKAVNNFLQGLMLK